MGCGWWALLLVLCAEHSLAILTCCEDDSCAKTCTASEEGGVCLRKDCFKTNKEPTVCAAGCGEETVDLNIFSGKIRLPRSQSANDSSNRYTSFCSEPRCNQNPAPVEKCSFKGPVPLKSLKCACTPEGMYRTKLHSRIESRVNTAQLCNAESNTCEWSGILATLKAVDLWSHEYDAKYGCVLKEDGAYGCDIFTVDLCPNSILCDAERHLSYRKHHLEIACRDGNYCNERTHYAKMVEFTNRCPEDLAVKFAYIHTPSLLLILFAITFL